MAQGANKRTRERAGEGKGKRGQRRTDNVKGVKRKGGEQCGSTKQQEDQREMKNLKVKSKIKTSTSLMMLLVHGVLRQSCCSSGVRMRWAFMTRLSHIELVDQVRVDMVFGDQVVKHQVPSNKKHQQVDQ